MDSKKEEELKGLDFSEALKLLVMGHKARRLGWEDDSAFVCSSKEPPFEERIMVYHWGKSKCLPWFPGHTDLYARDWAIARF